MSVQQDHELLQQALDWAIQKYPDNCHTEGMCAVANEMTELGIFGREEHNRLLRLIREVTDKRSYPLPEYHPYLYQMLRDLYDLHSATPVNTDKLRNLWIAEYEDRIAYLKHSSLYSD